VTDQLVYQLLYADLDDAALTAGAGAYSLVAQHLSGWFADQRRWLDALYRCWVADEESGAANLATLRDVVARALTRARAALQPVADRADALVGAGCGAALADAVEQTRAHLAALGITEEY
jgi:phenol hydroxylase P1 protein